MEGLFEGVRRAAAVKGEKMKDERREIGLEGVFHTVWSWGLGYYGVIGVKWAEGAEEVLGAKE